ncbi:hypothetical protein ACLB2K_031380 [Fragaria x ananassa]
MKETHSSAYAAHPGSTKMYKTLKDFYWWPNMKREISAYVSKCLICQQVKVERQKPSDLLDPLPIPIWKWDNITMDFVISLPRTRDGHDGMSGPVPNFTMKPDMSPAGTTSMKIYRRTRQTSFENRQL